MKITSSGKGLSEITEDVLIVPVFEGDTPREGALAALDHLTGGQIAALFAEGDFDCKRDRSVFLRNGGALVAKRLLFYGGGSANTLDSLNVQRLAGGAMRLLADRGVRTAAFLLSEKIDGATGAQAIVEGAMLGQMSCGLYRTSDRPKSQVEELVLVRESAGDMHLDRAIEVGRCMAEAANFARNLGFEPSNIMTPTELARRAREMAEREGLGCEVLAEDEMKRNLDILLEMIRELEKKNGVQLLAANR